MLGQLNAFDFIVTVALGSILAMILLNVAFLEGLTAMVLLGGLYFVAGGVGNQQNHQRGPRWRAWQRVRPEGIHNNQTPERS